MFQDTYKTIVKATEALFTDRGSKFISIAFPCSTEEDFRSTLKKIKAEHRKANHHCFAYVLGSNKESTRSNDDGEPSGTAGLPILRQINANDLTNCAVIVVRYFGGTLLGVGGLINAYKSAAALAIESCTIIEKHIEEKYSIQFEYSDQSFVQQIISEFDIKIINQHFESKILFTCSVLKSKADAFLTALKSYPLDSTRIKIKVVHD
ncbi:MAG TPA: YigZ family protein [Bacteroidia bacterium]|nr:YigZ family protein [Bacteroidia bacterium]